MEFLVPPKPSYKWLQNDVWLNLVELSKLYQFSDILNSVSYSSKNSSFLFFLFHLALSCWFNMGNMVQGMSIEGYYSDQKVTIPVFVISRRMNPNVLNYPTVGTGQLDKFRRLLLIRSLTPASFCQIRL